MIFDKPNFCAEVCVDWADLHGSYAGGRSNRQRGVACHRRCQALSAAGSSPQAANRPDVRPRALRSAGRREQNRARPGAGAPARAAGRARTARRGAPLGAPPHPVGWLFGSRDREEPAKGLYIYGDVGRGKTMLMDLFFEASPVVRKRRAHFHEFMADVHERVRAFRQKLKYGEIADDDPIRLARGRDRRGELAALLRRVPRHRHRRRDDPRPAVRAAVRARRGGGRDLERARPTSSTGTGSTARCSCRSSP